MVRKLVMWGLILCLEHSILIISHMLKFAMTRWDNFDSYTWTLVLRAGAFALAGMNGLFGPLAQKVFHKLGANKNIIGILGQQFCLFYNVPGQ